MTTRETRRQVQDVDTLLVPAARVTSSSGATWRPFELQNKEGVERGYPKRYRSVWSPLPELNYMHNSLTQKVYPNPVLVIVPMPGLYDYWHLFAVRSACIGPQGPMYPIASDNSQFLGQ